MTQRSTTTRDRDRATIRRGKPPCGICQQPIDYTLKSPDPMSFEVDHVIPLGKNPAPERVAELDVLSNKQASHRQCNRAKWHHTAEQVGPRTFETWRVW